MKVGATNYKNIVENGGDICYNKRTKKQKEGEIMFCPNCGRNNPDYAAVCGGCGTSLRDDAQPQQNAYQPYQQQPNYQQNQQPNYQHNNYQQPNYPPQQNPYQPYQNQPNYAQPPISPLNPGRPMKWYKFLIYFLLFVGALGNLAMAGILATGSQYVNSYGNNVSEVVYKVFPTLQTLDIIMAVYSVAMAVFSIYTRFRLSGYYKNAGKCVFNMYLISAAVNLVYIIAAYAIIGESDALDMSSQFTGFAISLAIAFCNKTYFDKRKDLFTR